MYAIAVLSVLLVSGCTQKVKLRADIDVPSGPVSLVSATFQTLTLYDPSGSVIPGAEEYEWKEDSVLGIYDSDGQCNVRYNIRKAYVGKTGKAFFYGKEVTPALWATLGYYDEGFPLMKVQPYCTNPYAQMMEGNIFVAETDADDFDFICRTGLLELECAVQLEGVVEDVRFSGSATSVTVSGIGRKCTTAEPLIVYIVLMPGEYENCMASFTMADGTVISKPIDGVVSIKASNMSSAHVSAKNYEYGNEDFIGTDMEFDNI